MSEPQPVTAQAQAAISEIPDSCTCTWQWGAPHWRWVRIGVKEDCPWHRVADTLGVKQP